MFLGKIRKSFINRDLKLYRDERLLQVNIEVEAFRMSKQKELTDLALRSHTDAQGHEHKYHLRMEELGINIAKLEAKEESLDLVVKAREEVVSADQNLLNAKSKEIERLNKLLTKLIEKQPSKIVVETNN